MGHDITAYKAEDKDKAIEVSYLRRNAFNPLGRVIYQALEAQDCDCGCSGCGTQRTFTNDQLSEAKKRIPPGEETDRERKFLDDCIAVGGAVTVCFW